MQYKIARKYTRNISSSCYVYFVKYFTIYFEVDEIPCEYFKFLIQASKIFMKIFSIIELRMYSCYSLSILIRIDL